MKKKWHILKSLFILPLLAFLVSGCYAPTALPIQVLRPAEKSLPDSLATVGVLNAALVESDFFLEEDSLWHTNMNSFLQNIASNEFSLTLAEVLMVSPRFSYTSGIEVLELDPHVYLDTIPPPFAPVELKAIASDFGRDIILAVEYFHLNQIPVPSGFNVNLNRPDHSVFSMFTDALPKDINLVRTEILLRMYDAESGFALGEIHLSDSVLWLTSLNYNRSDEEFSDEHYFFYENTGRYLGEKLAKKLAPWWDEEERDYYWGTQVDFNLAYFYALDNKWSFVENIMKEVTTHKNRRKAGFAWFNLAVSLEMQGKIQEAFEALENAARLKPPAGMLNYRTALIRRLKENEILDRQLQN